MSRRFGSFFPLMSPHYGSSVDAEGKFYPLIVNWPGSKADGMVIGGGGPVRPTSFTLPGTDIVVDIHGQPVGTPPAGLVDQVVSWVKANPLPALGIAAGIGYLVSKR